MGVIAFNSFYSSCGFLGAVPAFLDRGMRLGFGQKLRMHLDNVEKEK